MFLFLLYAQLLKEILSKIIKLIWHDSTKIINKTSCLRYGVLINLLISVYSNYYGIWNIINYLNDKDYRMLKSQIFFSLSELIPSYLYFECLNRYDLKSNKFQSITLSVIYPILSVSILHIYLGLLERLLWGFFASKYADAARNRPRDILLIINDICGIMFSIYYIIKIKKQNLLNAENHYFYIIYSFFLVFLAYFFYVMFCSF